MMVPWPEVESRVLTPIRPFDGKVDLILFFHTIIPIVKYVPVYFKYVKGLDRIGAIHNRCFVNIVVVPKVLLIQKSSQTAII